MKQDLIFYQHSLNLAYRLSLWFAEHTINN